MKNKKAGRWQAILLIVCICFFIGVLVGALSAGELKNEQAEALKSYAYFLDRNDIGFGKLFVKHGKYIAGIWLAGFLYSGAVIILIIVFTIGIFYGFSASFAAAQRGIGYVALNLLPQNCLLIPLYIFASVWSLGFVLNRFSNNGPKSRIRRERNKRLSEHLVILICCMAFNGAACLSEIYITGSILGLIN
ncbi:MAG: stage II sporulation protein M [Clostridiales bacterium]|nr:stage II sporulation protein M [Clostridiales bacterium]